MVSARQAASAQVATKARYSAGARAGPDELLAVGGGRAVVAQREALLDEAHPRGVVEPVEAGIQRAEVRADRRETAGVARRAERLERGELCARGAPGAGQGGGGALDVGSPAHPRQPEVRRQPAAVGVGGEVVEPHDRVRLLGPARIVGRAARVLGGEQHGLDGLVGEHPPGEREPVVEPLRELRRRVDRAEPRLAAVIARAGEGVGGGGADVAPARVVVARAGAVDPADEVEEREVARQLVRERGPRRVAQHVEEGPGIGLCDDLLEEPGGRRVLAGGSVHARQSIAGVARQLDVAIAAHEPVRGARPVEVAGALVVVADGQLRHLDVRRAAVGPDDPHGLVEGALVVQAGRDHRLEEGQPSLSVDARRVERERFGVAARRQLELEPGRRRPQRDAPRIVGVLLEHDAGLVPEQVAELGQRAGAVGVGGSRPIERGLREGPPSRDLGRGAGRLPRAVAGRRHRLPRDERRIARPARVAVERPGERGHRQQDRGEQGHGRRAPREG